MEVNLIIIREHSVLLFCNLIYTNVGSQVQITDEGVFKNITFHRLMTKQRLHLPPKMVSIMKAKRKRLCN